jgi:acetylornithine/succinyldiaminopimelate/putrescine aminotransferase
MQINLGMRRFHIVQKLHMQMNKFTHANEQIYTCKFLPGIRHIVQKFEEKNVIFK